MHKRIIFILLNLAVFNNYAQIDTTYTNLKNAFQNPENVYNLNLSGEDLKKRHFKNFEAFKNLKQLNLSWCGLTVFPEEILKCKHLKLLNLDMNSIISLPEAISQLTLLEELSLVNSELEYLPNTIIELTKLKVLNLKGNHNLIQLPKNFNHLNNLEFLYIKCSTTEFSQVLCEMKSLKNLNIYADSSFEPCEIIKLSNLESFSMIFHLAYFTPFSCPLNDHLNLNKLTIYSTDMNCCPWYILEEKEINKMKSLLPNECELIGIRLSDFGEEIKSDIKLR